jgi:hypothetical protein
MGSLCGGNTQTTTSQQTTTPANLAGLQNIFSQVQGAAATPYTPYSGELTAPVNAQQQSGIAAVNAGANSAQPYYNTAAGYATQAGAPISAGAIQNYSNPFTQSVIDATQRQFDEGNGIQQQQVKGSAALAGALGGDRQAVAQSETARQQQLAQAPVIAGLNQQNYQQALQAAQADRSAAGNAAGTFGNLGTAAQQAALQGAGAQINAGTLQQTTQQAADQANYQQYLQKLAFPYQNAQFLAQYGTPAALAQGSSTSGTQTSPGPNLLAQLAGIGIAGAGVASKFGAKDGGRINYADGGSPFNFISDTHGYVPTGGGAPQISLPQSQLKFADPQKPDMTPITSALSGIGKGTFRNPFASSGSGGWGATSTGSEGVGDIGGFYSHGGLVHAIHAIHSSIKRSRGGSVIDMPFAGYDSGGTVRHYADGGATFDERFGGDQPLPDEQPFRLAGPEAMDAWRKGVDQPNAAVQADAGVPQLSPPIAPANPMRLPPQITGPQQDDNESSGALAFDTPSQGASPLSIAPQAPTEAQSTSPFKISGKASDAMIAAGLGMMASRSPFALSALGEGGLHGLKNYSDATAAEREAADKKITQGQNQARVDMEAKRIAQSAEQFAKTNKLAERRQTFAEDKTPEGYRAKKEGSYEPIPGGPADPEMLRKVAEAKRVSGAPIDDDTASFVADQVLAGDSRALIGFGRGAQGAENLIKVRALVAQKARAQGLDPTDILNNVAIQSGNTATQRTFGTQTAKMAINATEAQGAIELGRAASAAVPRTNWVPVNKAIQAYQTGTSDPALAKFGAANLAIINTYARAISPTGVPTVNDKVHAEHLLSTATGPDAYKAVLDQMNEEIKIAHAAPAKAKQEIEDIRKGRGTSHDPSKASTNSYEETKEIGGKKYGRIGKDWFAL